MLSLAGPKLSTITVAILEYITLGRGGENYSNRIKMVKSKTYKTIKKQTIDICGKIKIAIKMAGQKYQIQIAGTWGDRLF